MNFSDNKKVENFFDNYAYDFDSIYGSLKERNFLTKILDKYLRKSMFNRYKLTMNFLFDKNNSIKSCLDIGSGPGRYSIDCALKGILTLGVDMSEQMIEIANQRTPSEVKKNLNFKCADYLNLKLENKYDASILMGFFDYIKDPELIFDKLKKNSNKFVLASFPKKYEIFSFQRLIRYKFRNCPLYFYTKKRIKKILYNSKISDYTIVDNHREYFLIIRI